MFFMKLMVIYVVSVQWMNPYTLTDAIEFENSWTLAIQLEVWNCIDSILVEMLIFIAI